MKECQKCGIMSCLSPCNCLFESRFNCRCQTKMINRDPFLIQPSQWYQINITLTSLTPQVAESSGSTTVEVCACCQPVSKYLWPFYSPPSKGQQKYIIPAACRRSHFCNCQSQRRNAGHSRTLPFKIQRMHWKFSIAFWYFWLPRNILAKHPAILII